MDGRVVIDERPRRPTDRPIIADYPDQFDDVHEFDTIGKVPVGIGEGNLALRFRLAKEEYQELEYAYATDRLVEQVDAYADLAYVALGALLTMLGEDVAREVWNAVQASNMSKFPSGKVFYNEHGKVVKPPGWNNSPDIRGILERAGITVGTTENGDESDEAP